MKLKLYGVRDKKAEDCPLILTAPNEALLIRQIKSGLLSKGQHFLNTDIDDKEVWELGSYDTTTMVIVSDGPHFIITISEIYDELISEIRARKEKLKGIQEVEVPEGGTDE